MKKKKERKKEKSTNSKCLMTPALSPLSEWIGCWELSNRVEQIDAKQSKRVCLFEKPKFNFNGK